MKYLFVKMRRDLLHMWTQFLSVFLMAAIGVLIYVGMEGQWYGLRTSVNKYYKDSNLASAWVYGNNLTESDCESISKISGVKETSLSMSTKVSVETNEGNEPTLKLTAPATNNISKPETSSGKDFDLNGDGIWVDKRFAEKHKLSTDDTITIKYGKFSKELTIKGLITSPEGVYYTGTAVQMMPDYNKYGYAMISQATAQKMFGKIINNEMRVKLSDNTDSETFKKSAQDVLGDKYVNYADKDTLLSVAQPLKQSKQLMKVSIMFSSVFVLLALLTMQTTMTRLVANQRVQIGTLKALGVHDYQIKCHYALYGLTVGLLGGIFGALLAPRIITPILLNVLSNLYVVPQLKGTITIVSYIVILAVALSCTGATVLACRKSLKGMPAQTLRGLAPKGGKKILLERFSHLWNKMSFGWKWSMRDIARSKLRTIMGTVGVLGCMMLLMASLGLQNTLDYSNNYVYNTQYTYGTKAILQQNATEENMKELQSVSGDSQWVSEMPVEINNNNTLKNGLISIVDDGSFINLETTDNKKITFPSDGVYVTRKMADMLDLNKGDTVEFNVAGSSETLKAEITEIVSAPSPQGIYISSSQWEKFGKKFSPTALLIKSDDVKTKLDDLGYIQEVTTLENQRISAQNYSNALSTVFTLLKIAAIALGVVILYNLGILCYTERTREYATLKVLGFYQKEIRSYSQRENTVITLLGWIIGIPVGLIFLYFYVNVISMESFEWVRKLKLISIIIATFITVGCSVGVSLLLCQKVKKINMVEALKSVD